MPLKTPSLTLATLCTTVALFAQGAAANCLPIKEVKITGVALFDEETIRSWRAPFEGRCLGFDEFNKVLETVTSAYIDAGYISSRAYLPEQDLSQGVLTIATVEGRIEAVRFNSEIDHDWQTLVYPNIIDEIAQIRTIEQGLDTIRTMQSFSAEMELQPGSQTGQSILDISAKSEKPWALKYSANNYSQEPLGEYSSTISLTYDHLLGINDIWEISHTKSMSPNPFNWGYDGLGTKAYSIGLTLPYGKWENKFSIARSYYEQETPGIATANTADGWSSTHNLNFKRLIHRDQESKTHLSFSINRAENENFSNGVFIEVSSRILTTGAIELSHERPFKKGTFKGSLRLEKGLRGLGAENASQQSTAQPDAQFLRLLANASYEKSWKRDNANIGYSATFSGQYSNDRLYGGQQFAIGGVSTVRGTFASLARGSKGAFLRQEISYTPTKLKTKHIGQPELYAGLDYGFIAKDKSLDTKFWQATGATLGLRLKSGFADIDISYAKLIDANQQSNLNIHQPSGVWMATIAKKF